MIEIIHYEVENNIPKIKTKNKNTDLPETIWQKMKNKRNLRRIYIQNKNQSKKPSLNLFEKKLRKLLVTTEIKKWGIKLLKN